MMKTKFGALVLAPLAMLPTTAFAQAASNDYTAEIGGVKSAVTTNATAVITVVVALIIVGVVIRLMRKS